MFSMAVFVVAEDARRLSRGFGYQRQWYDNDNGYQGSQHTSWEYASTSAAYGKVLYTMNNDTCYSINIVYEIVALA